MHELPQFSASKKSMSPPCIARKHNQNIPGMGGLFNAVNLSLFHYVGNNPVRYVEHTGLAQAVNFICLVGDGK